MAQQKPLHGPRILNYTLKLYAQTSTHAPPSLACNSRSPLFQQQDEDSICLWHGQASKHSSTRHNKVMRVKPKANSNIPASRQLAQVEIPLNRPATKTSDGLARIPTQLYRMLATSPLLMYSLWPLPPCAHKHASYARQLLPGGALLRVHHHRTCAMCTSSQPAGIKLMPP